MNKPNYLTFGIFTSLLIVIITITIFIVFPWRSSTRNFFEARTGLFLTPWPENPLDEVIQNKKLLRRYPKKEQMRRANVNLRRMLFVDNIVLDILASQYFKIVDTDIEYWNEFHQAHQWYPSYLLRRQTLSDSSQVQDLKMLSPLDGRGFLFKESVTLHPGREFRFHIPNPKTSLALRLNVLPSHSGQIRIMLGQNTLANRSIGNHETNQWIPLRISIPDELTSNNEFRIFTYGTNITLGSAVIVAREKIGRMPIQLGSIHPEWEPINIGDPYLSGESNQEENQPENAIQQVYDPIDQLMNPVVTAEFSGVKAIGYNIILIHAGEGKNSQQLGKYDLPKAQDRFKNAMSIKIKLSEDTTNIFKKFILNKDLPIDPYNPFELKTDIQSNFQNTLYNLARKYGYLTWVAAPGQALSLPSIHSKLPPLMGRSLSENEWKIANHNRTIDAVSDSITGLDAVFQTKNTQMPSPILKQDWELIHHLVQTWSKEVNKIPDWGMHEVFIPEGNNNEIANLVAQIQKNIEITAAQRFFAHINLSQFDKKPIVSLQDYARALVSLKFKLLTNQKDLYFSNRIMDRSIDQIFDSLVAHKIAHRSIVVLVIPSDNNTLDLKLLIPGLKAKTEKTVSSITEALDIILSKVGIADEYRVSNSRTFRSYHLFFSGHDALCTSIGWKSPEPIRNLHQEFVNVKLSDDRKEVKAQNCDEKSDYSWITWTQNKDALGGVLTLPKSTNVFLGPNLMPASGEEFNVLPTDAAYKKIITHSAGLSDSLPRIFKTLKDPEKKDSGRVVFVITE